MDPAEKFEFKGINHVALVARDMAETTEFYENVLDMPLVMAIPIPGGGQHFFFDCGNGDTVAFFWFKDAPPVAPGIASQHRDVRKNGAATAHGSMNHLAFSIAPENFDRYLERLHERGIETSIINHNDPPHEALIDYTETTWIRSMYFFDPNGIKLEFAATLREFNENDIALEPFDADGKPVKINRAKQAESA